jgi:hypothetical protein
MLKLSRGIWRGALLFFCLMSWEGQALGQVKEIATHRDRMALPPDAVFEATLEDVSRTDGFCRKVQMKASEFITLWYLRSQRIKLLCWRFLCIFRRWQLSLANRMHDFNPCDRTAGRPKRFDS